MTIEQVIIDITAHINNIPFRYSEIPAEELLERPAPGKWSKKEILGHLIDSAINNLKRFVDVQRSATALYHTPVHAGQLSSHQPLPGPPARPYAALVENLNQQIVYVISAIPAEKFPIK